MNFHSKPTLLKESQPKLNFSSLLISTHIQSPLIAQDTCFPNNTNRSTHVHY